MWKEGSSKAEANLVLKDGRQVSYEFTGSILKDSKGNIIGFSGIGRDLTERKQAEEELAHQHAFLRQVIDSNPNLIFVKDRNDRYLLANRATAETFGTSVEYMLGKTDIELGVLPEEFAKYRQDDIDVLQSGKVKLIPEERYTWPSGEVHYYQTTKHPQLDEKGITIGVLAVCVDITERKQAEEALRMAEEKYRSIFDNAVEGIFQTTPEGLILSANSALARIFGYDSPEDLMSSITDIGRQLYIDPEKRKEHLRLLNEKGVVKNFEAQIYRKDGSTNWVSINTRIVRDDAGNPLLFEGFVEDITERKQAEEALRKAEQELHLTLDATTDGIYKWNFKTNVLFFSPRYYTMLGYDPGELPATYETWKSLIHPDDLAGALRVAQDYLASKPDRYESEFRMRTKAAGYCWIHARSRVVERDEHGAAVRIIGNHEDITERKLAEEALQKSEERYRSLFEDSPISLWEENFSDVKAYIDNLRDSGVKDFRTYFENHPEAVVRCAAMVKIIGINKATLNMYKAKSKEEFLKGLGLVFAEESYDAFREELIAIAEGKTTFEIEAITRTLTDDKVHITLKWSVAPGYEETLSKVLISIIDVTERKQAEEALVNSERKYRILVENVPQKIFYKDRNSIYVSCNQNYAQDLEIKPEEIAGKTDYEFYPKELAEKYRADDKRIMEKRQIESIEERYIQGGQDRIVQTFKVPVRDEKGNVIGVFGIFSDIAEHKRMEEVIKDSEKKYRTLVDNSLVGIYRTNLKGEFLYTNDALTKIFEFQSREEMMAKAVQEIYKNPKDRDVLIENLKERGMVKNFELEVFTKTGKTKNVLISASLEGEPYQEWFTISLNACRQGQSGRNLLLNFRKHLKMSKHSVAFCLSVCRVKRYEMTKDIGIKSKNI